MKKFHLTAGEKAELAMVFFPNKMEVLKNPEIDPIFDFSEKTIKTFLKNLKNKELYSSDWEVAISLLKIEWQIINKITKGIEKHKFLMPNTDDYYEAYKQLLNMSPYKYKPNPYWLRNRIIENNVFTLFSQKFWKEFKKRFPKDVYDDIPDARVINGYRNGSVGLIKFYILMKMIFYIYEGAIDIEFM